MSDLDEAHANLLWNLIPPDTDVLVVHGPPRGLGDLAASGMRTGSESLTDRIREIQPVLVVCGHIHEGHGVYELGQTTIANASLHNRHFLPANRMISFDLRKSTDSGTGVPSRAFTRVG